MFVRIPQAWALSRAKPLSNSAQIFQQKTTSVLCFSPFSCRCCPSNFASLFIIITAIIAIMIGVATFIALTAATKSSTSLLLLLIFLLLLLSSFLTAPVQQTTVVDVVLIIIVIIVILSFGLPWLPNLALSLSSSSSFCIFCCCSSASSSALCSSACCVSPSFLLRQACFSLFVLRALCLRTSVAIGGRCCCCRSRPSSVETSARIRCPRRHERYWPYRLCSISAWPRCVQTSFASATSARAVLQHVSAVEDSAS